MVPARLAGSRHDGLGQIAPKVKPDEKPLTILEVSLFK